MNRIICLILMNMSLYNSFVFLPLHSLTFISSFIIYIIKSTCKAEDGSTWKTINKLVRFFVNKKKFLLPYCMTSIFFNRIYLKFVHIWIDWKFYSTFSYIRKNKESCLKQMGYYWSSCVSFDVLLCSFF